MPKRIVISSDKTWNRSEEDLKKIILQILSIRYDRYSQLIQSAMRA